MKKILMSNIWRIGLQVAIGVGIFFVAQLYQQRNLLPASSNTPAPDFLLEEVESSQKYSLQDFKGKKLLLYFFAPWCGVCKLSIGSLQDVFSKLDKNNYAVVAVALSYENKREILDFKKEHKLSLPVLLGSEIQATQYQIDAFPTYYVINKQGNIVARDLGFSTSIGMYLRLK